MEPLKNLLNGEKINYDFWVLTHIALSFVDPEKDELVLAFVDAHFGKRAQ